METITETFSKLLQVYSFQNTACRYGILSVPAHSRLLSISLTNVFIHFLILYFFLQIKYNYSQMDAPKPNFCLTYIKPSVHMHVYFIYYSSSNLFQVKTITFLSHLSAGIALLHSSSRGHCSSRKRLGKLLKSDFWKGDCFSRNPENKCVPKSQEQ